MHILAISGSLRKASTNTMLLRAAEQLAPEGMAFEHVNLKGIPVYDGDDEDRDGVPEIVTGLVERIIAADGVLIATPEYNFSIPGGLKNATDWISRVDGQPLRRKPTGIMGAAAGPLGTARVQYHLRQNLQALNAAVLTRPEIFVGTAQDKFDADGQLCDETTQKFLATYMRVFAKWVEGG